MKTFSISKNDVAFKLLSKMLILDPKKRISATEALRHEYFTAIPHPTNDIFSCYKLLIPFPNRKFLSKKVKAPKFVQKTRIARKTHLQELNI